MGENLITKSFQHEIDFKEAWSIKQMQFCEEGIKKLVQLYSIITQVPQIQYA